MIERAFSQEVAGGEPCVPAADDDNFEALDGSALGDDDYESLDDSALGDDD